MMMELGMMIRATHSGVVPAKAGTHTPCTIQSGSPVIMGPRLRGDDIHRGTMTMTTEQVRS
jgi:hypothetical protein